jgi:hypothetical protein
MLIYAIIVFLIAAVGGAFMAYRILNGEFAPWAVSLIHLALGGAGLVLVLLAVMAGEAGFLGWLTFAILLVTALGGFLLATLHLRKRLAPAGLVILHACLGGAGVLMLLGIAFLFADMSTTMTADPNTLVR